MSSIDNIGLIRYFRTPILNIMTVTCDQPMIMLHLEKNYKKSVH